jgi:acetyl-CoA carboxylase biotin carboxyl carrier protein
MNIAFIRKLVNLVEELGVEEVEIRRFFTSVRIRKNSSGVVKSVERIPARQTKEGGQKKEETVPAVKENENTVAVRAPMVGTFYRAPAPDAPPYVDIGDHIRKGQIVCIVEAMKIMNEIESEVGGVVIDVLAKNEDPVEYNQELFLVKPE